MTRKQLLQEALAARDGNGVRLAEELGITNPNSAATFVNRYPKAKAIEFDRTIKLLRIAGRLREDPVPPIPDAAEATALLHRIADFLERLERALHEPTQPGTQTAAQDEP